MELEPGKIVVERLTGKRAIVIQIASDDEVRCRFGDGRLEDRFTFELEPIVPFVDWLVALAVAPFLLRPRERAASGSDRKRPMLVRGAQ